MYILSSLSLFSLPLSSLSLSFLFSFLSLSSLSAMVQCIFIVLYIAEREREKRERERERYISRYLDIKISVARDKYNSCVFLVFLGKYFCGRTNEPATKIFLEKVYPLIDSFIYSILPLTSLFVLNTIMMCHMKRRMRRRLSIRDAAISENQSNQTQITAMLLLVSVSFLLLTGPMGILLIVERYVWVPGTMKEKAVARLVHSVIDNLMYMNHAINFIFYCFSGRKFRTELKRMCCCTGKLRESNLNQVVSTVS